MTIPYTRSQKQMLCILAYVTKEDYKVYAIN